MPCKVTPTELPEVLILEPKVFGDERGFFFESFNDRDFRDATGLKEPLCRIITAARKRAFYAGFITR